MEVDSLHGFTLAMHVRPICAIYGAQSKHERDL
jgi:hypothetical protein